jgi:hypothetical protein
MKSNQRKNIFVALFITIIVFAAFIRLYKLDLYPPQLNRDEAALAINALYIHQAGVDEWGNHYPLQFKSFGDFKLPGYIYLLSVIFTFGTNDVIVRLPAAIAGVVLIVSSWFWSSALYTKTTSRLTQLALSAMMAVAPFAVFYSRMAWEANLGLALMITSLAVLHQKQHTLRTDLIAVALYFMAAITYNSPFLLLPFFIITLPVMRGVREYKDWLFAVIALSMVFVSIAGLFAVNNSQKAGILFFSDANVLAEYPQYRNGLPAALRPIIGNRYVYYGKIAATHYIETFLPKFLISHGGQHPWHSIMGRGHLYWSMYILFWVGVVTQLRRVLQVVQKKAKPRELLPIFFLLISPFPAIFTTDAPHATRSLFTFLMIVIFAAIGLEQIYLLVRRRHTQFAYLSIGLISFLMIVETGQYLHQYFVIWPNNFSSDFQLGIVPVLSQIDQSSLDGNVAVIDDDWYMYVIVAWYLKLPVTEVLETIERSGPDTVGLYRVERVGKYYFVRNDKQLIPNEALRITREGKDRHWQL